MELGNAVVGNRRVTVEIECTFGNPELAGVRDASDHVAEMLRPALEAMDNACTTVLALGYNPEQCEIVAELSSNGCRNKRTLLVLGRPCFEVTIETKPIGPPDWTLEVVTTPRDLGWPPAVTP